MLFILNVNYICQLFYWLVLSVDWLLLFIRYFLNLFGLRGLFSLILGEENGKYAYNIFTMLL